ncbi:MAG: HD domain-containing protein [Halobacteria archaeon]|nr:HD domain-containing protein [Halobacteria archaeon]
MSDQMSHKKDSVTHQEFKEMMEFVKFYLKDTLDSDGDRMRWYPWHSPQYRYEHILGTMRLGEKIARQENANVDVVKVAALFHDIAKFEVDQEVHAEEGAQVAREYLSSEGYSDTFIEKVVRTVKDHSKGMDEGLPLESKILMEADAIDKIGVAGATLLALRVGYESRPHTDIPEMIDRVIDRGKSILNWIETETGRRIALERIERAKTYRDWFKDERGEN